MPATDQRPVRVLLLEDSAIDGEFICHQLMKLGPHVHTERVAIRREFESALALRHFDIILADYSLPDFDGAGALEVAREASPQTPFIFVSGVLGEDLATEALRAGATDYVTKRDLSRIPMVVERALREAREREAARLVAIALHESEARFRAMSDSAPALVWSVDGGGRIVFANRRFLTDFGVPPERMMTEGWSAIVHEEDWPAFNRARSETFAARQHFSADVRVRAAGGQVRWLRCESSPRHDETGTFLGYVGCAVDITQNKLATDVLEAEIAARTRELRLKDDVLRQSQKMESIGQLAGGIAHDFNNMLAGIMGGADLLRRGLRQGRYGECERYLDAVILSANKATSLTHRLLAFSRQQTLDIKSTGVNRLVTSLEDLMRRTIGEAIQLKTMLAAGLWPAMIDANQLENALLNLAINARDAMPGGGELTIETSNVTIGEATATGELRPGDYVVVAVGDNGTGMGEDVLAKVFEPFFTTKPIGQGTGLGLSMIYGFMTQIEGHVTIRSSPGRGTCVSLFIPRGRILVEEETVPEPEKRRPNGRGTLLVVEDEAIIAMLLVDYLEAMGYTVISASEAGEALPVLRGDTHLDLMLTDIGLPGMNGRELAGEARKVRPALKIIFATGYAEGAGKQSDFVGQNMDFIGKPYDFDVLGGKIDALIAR